MKIKSEIYKVQLLKAGMSSVEEVKSLLQSHIKNASKFSEIESDLRKTVDTAPLLKQKAAWEELVSLQHSAGADFRVFSTSFRAVCLKL